MLAAGRATRRTSPSCARRRGPPPREADHRCASAAVATRSADDCTRLATGGHLQQREHGAASAALEECSNGVFDRDRGLLDGPVEVTTVEVDGREASAGVVFQGERNPGLSAELALVDDGGWKLDRSVDYLEADRSKLERAFRTEILGARVSFPKPIAEWAVGRLSAHGDADLERLLLAGSSQAVYAPVIACDRAGAVERIAAGLSGQSPGLPDAAAACVRERLTALPDPQLIRILLDADYDAAALIVLDCDRAAVLSGYRDRLLGPQFSLSPRSVECIIDRLEALPTARLRKVLDGDGIQTINEACGASPNRG